MREEQKTAESVPPGESGDGTTASRHAYTRLVVNRLSRAIGHLEAVKKMAQEGRNCTDILIQLAAVRGALGSISRVVLKDHMEHCLADGDRAAMEELNRAIDQLIK